MKNDRKLKILHILDHSLPLHSGYTFRSRNIFRMQKKMGWAPVVLTSSKHEENIRQEKMSNGANCGMAIIDEVPYYRTGALPSSRVPIIPDLRVITTLASRLKEVSGIEKPDVLHAHSPILNAIPALWVGRKLNIPVVYEIRAFWEDAAVDHGTYGADSWKYKLVRSIETKVCEYVDAVAVICNGLKEDLVTRGISAGKISIVPNGVNLDDFRHREADVRYVEDWNLRGKKVIGFIGSFYRYEGLNLLIDAFADLASKRTDIVLLLVGGGEMEGELREKIRGYDLGSRVIMPGRISHESIPRIYPLIDVLVYPRYSMRLTELVTPLKPLESMAMGKAVVASDIGGHRELIRNNVTGYLFRPADVSALSEGIRKVLDDPRLRGDLEKQALEWVRQERSWERSTEVYGNLYSTIVKQHLRPAPG